MKYTPPIKFKFDKKKHTYTSEDGKLLTGVTNILKNLAKPALIQWSANECANYFKKNFSKITKENLEAELKVAKVSHRKIASTSAKIGSAVHEYIEEYYKREGVAPEEYLQALEMPYTDIMQVKLGIDAFISWNSTREPKIVSSELRVVSKEHSFAGTLDFLMEVDGELILGDFKTSKAIYPEYWLQLAGYQIALEEGGIKPIKRLAVRLDKKTGKFYEEYAPTPLDFDKDTFIKLREIHKWIVYCENNLKKY